MFTIIFIVLLIFPPFWDAINFNAIHCSIAPVQPRSIGIDIGGTKVI